MDEVEAFYERYIEAVNARDGAAFAACYHPPVTLLAAPRTNERGVGLRPRSIDDMSGSLAHLGPRWARSTIDSVVSLGDVPAAGRPSGAAGGGERPGLIATCTRWDGSGTPYERVQALYLCTRHEGRLGIKVVAELLTTPLVAP